ncbi:TadE/TadG family type IV pilus assembly protein [Roseibium sp.]|uniref:TadE/TadG family type IV pilus assembly protein n=1 Tax=Roseibium sp. TaxID=1936156 RepID=UPI003D0CEDB2
MARKKIRTWLGRFLNGESGGLTVESALWIPIYGAFFALVADVSIAMNGKAQAQRVIQDVNRLASFGYMVDADEIERRAAATISHISPNAEITTEIDEDTHIVSTVAVLPASDLMPLGILSAFADLEVTIYSIHLMES